MAAVHGGHAGLVAVAGPERTIRPPSFTDTGRIPSRTAQTRIQTARPRRTDEGQQQHENNQCDGTAQPDGHGDGPQQPETAPGSLLQKRERERNEQLTWT